MDVVWLNSQTSIEFNLIIFDKFVYWPGSDILSINLNEKYPL